MWVFLNNQFVEQGQARISVFDHGFLYGDGVFETVRAYDTQIFRWDRHLARLRSSCDAIGLLLPEPQSGWTPVFNELLQRNDLHDAIFRVTISRGEGGFGLDPSLCTTPTLVIFARLLPDYPSAYWEHGVTIALVQTRRNLPLALPPQVKSLNFLNNILAKQEASKAGAVDGLLLNGEGCLTECATSNIFFVHGGKLHTPSLDCGILGGITREAILELSGELSLAVEEGHFRPEGLFQAEECFLTNTSYEVLPVRAVGDRRIGSSCPGPVTRTLRARFQALVKQCSSSTLHTEQPDG